MTDSSTPPDAAQSVVLERMLDAPTDLVWRMWTEPDHFAAWYGPTGASIPVAKMDVRVGGTRLICMEMQTPDGTMQMWFTGEYREIDPQRRLVYTESMCDEDGNVKSASEMGMPDGHPTTTEVIVELGDLDGRTKMTMTHAGVPADSPGAMGWNMAFDKLVDHLATQTG
jgi:uncharacterized protein YndB with AHSA1/START domain